MTTVNIVCPVFPSEDPDKVRAAIERIFPDAVVGENDDGYVAT